MIFSACIIISVILFVSIPAITVHEEKCNETCSRERDPVCAKNNRGEYELFSNPCVFNSTKCLERDAGWEIVESDDCAPEKHCPKICTMEFNPICVKNSDNFHFVMYSPCALEAAKCNYSSKDWVRVETKDCPMNDRSCHYNCSDIPSPVCAKNLNGNKRYFNNLCVLKFIQCDEKSDGWVQIDNGECAEFFGRCPQYCPNNGQSAHVCAKKFNGVRRTFKNPCELTATQCAYPMEDWTMVSKTPCPNSGGKVVARNVNGELRLFKHNCFFESAKCLHPELGWQLYEP